MLLPKSSGRGGSKRIDSHAEQSKTQATLERMRKQRKRHDETFAKRQASSSSTTCSLSRFKIPFTLKENVKHTHPADLFQTKTRPRPNVIPAPKATAIPFRCSSNESEE